MANEKNNSVVPKIFREVVVYENIQLQSGDEILYIRKRAISGQRLSRWGDGVTFNFTSDYGNFSTTATVKSEEEFRQLMEKFAEAAGLDFKIEDAEGYVNTLRCKFKGKGFFRRRNKS